MPDGLDVRRKRLLFRSWHRGSREADLLLGSFAEQHLAAMNDGQLGRFELLLEASDAPLYEWITGREPPPPEFDTDVLHLILNFRYRPRAT